jgi:hypothetical protein
LSAIRIEDRALAAYLLERDLVPIEELLRALDDVRSSERTLGDVLMESGSLTATALRLARIEAAKRDSSETSTLADRDVDDTWFDLVKKKNEKKNEWDEEMPTRIPGVPYDDGLGPTSPYEPARFVEGDVLDSDTIRGGSPADPIVVDPPPPRQLRNSGVDLEIEKSNVRLAPSGKAVEERYQLLGEIGRGGMGRILKGRDTEIGREVAVKVLLGGGQAPDNLIRRFWTEVQATGQLEHPSIIPIHDVGRLPSGELFYVMKMLSGRSLAEIIQHLRDDDDETAREFTRVRMLTIFQQIAYAVAFSHARGVIHRDIKPANIMVGRFGESILLDWGLAKVQADPTLEVTEDLPRVRMVGCYSASETASGTITGTP